VAALNESLILALVRQHELAEQAELLNTQLQDEIVACNKAEDALLNVEKPASVARMAAVPAHEINNPLEAVLNVLYLTQAMKGLRKQLMGILKTADAELKRIAHITYQTLGVYRELSTPKSFDVSALQLRHS
jgi:two-component system NtrC family sensor kinase